MTDQVDIERRRGDTYAEEYEIESETTDLPIDITGYNFVQTVTTKPSPADASSKLFEISGNLTDPTNGIVEFAPSPAQADNVGEYYHDIQMTDGSSRVRTIAQGRYTMKQDRGSNLTSETRKAKKKMEITEEKIKKATLRAVERRTKGQKLTNSQKFLCFIYDKTMQELGGNSDGQTNQVQ